MIESIVGVSGHGRLAVAGISIIDAHGTSAKGWPRSSAWKRTERAAVSQAFQLLLWAVLAPAWPPRHR